MRTPPRSSSATVRECPVSFDVPERVVDALEIVDVDHQHRQRLVLAGGALHFTAKPRLEVAPVEETRDRVNGRNPLQIAETALHAFAGERQRCRRGEDARFRQILRVERLSILAIGQRQNAARTVLAHHRYQQVRVRAVAKATGSVDLVNVGFGADVCPAEDSLSRLDAQMLDEDGRISDRRDDRQRLVIEVVKGERTDPRPQVLGNGAKDQGVGAFAVGFASEASGERIDTASEPFRIARVVHAEYPSETLASPPDDSIGGRFVAPGLRRAGDEQHPLPGSRASEHEPRQSVPHRLAGDGALAQDGGQRKMLFAFGAGRKGLAFESPLLVIARQEREGRFQRRGQRVQQRAQVLCERRRACVGALSHSLL